MIRGTTPTLEFNLPFDVSTIAEAYITLAQGREVILNKRLADCECSDKKLTVRLSQAETLALKADNMTEVQVRVRTVDGDALASNIVKVPTYRILQGGEV